MIRLSETEMFKAFRELVATDPKNPERRSNDPLRRQKALKQWESLMQKHDIDGMIYRAIENTEKATSVDHKLSEAEIAWEQKARKAADTDLREACRQYYWPQWGFHGKEGDRVIINPIREHQDKLYALCQVDRDVILKANGYWSQREYEGNRQAMAANGVPFAKGSLEEGSTWKLKTRGDRPPYQYLDG